MKGRLFVHFKASPCVLFKAVLAGLTVVLVIFTLVTVPRAAIRAQPPTQPRPKTGVLIVSHGSRSASWRRTWGTTARAA